jgi:hypothetical protein
MSNETNITRTYKMKNIALLNSLRKQKLCVCARRAIERKQRVRKSIVAAARAQGRNAQELVSCMWQDRLCPVSQLCQAVL